MHRLHFKKSKKTNEDRLTLNLVCEGDDRQAIHMQYVWSLPALGIYSLYSLYKLVDTNIKNSMYVLKYITSFVEFLVYLSDSTDCTMQF